MRKSCFRQTAEFTRKMGSWGFCHSSINFRYKGTRRSQVRVRGFWNIFWMEKTLILTSNILKCFGETSTCVYKKTDHPESILFGSLNLNTITMTLLEFKVHIMMIIIAKFHKNRITFTYRIFTSKMCAITYGFKCRLWLNYRYSHLWYWLQ